MQKDESIPSLISEGFVAREELDQKKLKSKPKERPAEGVSTFYGCLSADSYWQIPVVAGQHYIVQAEISTRCNRRGWSNDNWVTSCGPNGRPGYFVNGSLGFPHSPVGALIGAVSSINTGESMDPTEAARVFALSFPVGSKRDDRSPIAGFLYLTFNDTWTWSDNKGSIEVTVYRFPVDSL